MMAFVCAQSVTFLSERDLQKCQKNVKFDTASLTAEAQDRVVRQAKSLSNQHGAVR